MSSAETVTYPAGKRSSLLSLEQSLALDMTAANAFYAQHLNKYMLQIFDILGLKDVDIKGAEGSEIWLNDGRTLLDFSGGLGVLGLGHNHPRIIAAECKCHDQKIIDCITRHPACDAAFVVQEAQIDKFVSALDNVLTRGVADATVRFIVKNIRRVLLRVS